jgi:DNA-directed RNA polymerase subunit RPC12/RpoP
MLDSDTGELEEKTLEHQGDTVREFYSALSGPILVGIEATGSMQWFLELLEELGIECRRCLYKILLLTQSGLLCKVRTLRSGILASTQSRRLPCQTDDFLPQCGNAMMRTPRLF